MLRQETVSRISLLVSIAGVSLLFLFAEAVQPREVKIQEIDQSLLEWNVKLNAKVLSSYQHKNTVFMQLYDGTGKIKAVLFRPSEEIRPLIAKDSFASFEGKVQLYEEELELVVKRVMEWP
jgi:DNA/RNA endonuclease YhcR with UshA esterase domain